jgi:hypothetical protein
MPIPIVLIELPLFNCKNKEELKMLRKILVIFFIILLKLVHKTLEKNLITDLRVEIHLIVKVINIKEKIIRMIQFRMFHFSCWLEILEERKLLKRLEMLIKELFLISKVKKF